MNAAPQGNPLLDRPLATRNTYPKDQHVWIWKVFSTKKNPRGCDTWTGPWKILGPVLDEQCPEQQWRTIGSLYEDIVPLQTVKQGRYLWPFHQQDVYCKGWTTKTVSYSLESHGNFLEIQAGDGPGDLKLQECLDSEDPDNNSTSLGLGQLLLKRDTTLRFDRLSSRATTSGAPQDSQKALQDGLVNSMKSLAVHPAVSRFEIEGHVARERESSGRHPLAPYSQPDYDHFNNAAPFYSFPEDQQQEASGHCGVPWSTNQTNLGDQYQPGGTGTPALVYDRPPPPYPPRIKVKQPPAGYSFSASWYRNLSGLRPIVKGTQTIRHYQEVLVEHVRVRAVIDDNITIGLASRSFLATLAVYLPKIPVPVLLEDNQDVPPDVSATYLTISSLVRGVHNHCLHPVLVAPSLGGEKLVLGVAYLRENAVEGYQAYLQAPVPTPDTVPQDTCPAWWQAAQDQINNQYHYTPDWSSE